MAKYWKPNTQIQRNTYCECLSQVIFQKLPDFTACSTVVNLDMKNYSIYVIFCFFLEGYHSYILQSDSYLCHRLLQVSPECANLLNLISIMQLYFWEQQWKMLSSIAGICGGWKERKMRHIILTWSKGWKFSVCAFSKLFLFSVGETIFHIPHFWTTPN